MSPIKSINATLEAGVDAPVDAIMGYKCCTIDVFDLYSSFCRLNNGGIIATADVSVFVVNVVLTIVIDISDFINVLGDPLISTYLC